ncbi:MAG: hypothetical protein A2675_01655 [Candidatus Yonathbacteria bacterium RIFCSPHIGHO2_01_FULL_51_10]|uniref:Uncharacterized protein n=1 Tax=Candidatus Yonathbacteria bacterium RIFCSPHIGHO2_01_FULL_51_10 TaxID=1802723 RepID=A0A1G2S6U2_9BACT|nr:MAG: hypothetical protein A2675_01655 [Candidatus Yonathbacteria bacterium RIFCSPHIGHO2_01_FULL_51_10]
MKKPSWRDINGKTINFKTVGGEIIESLVIADPRIGVSIKPLDRKEVPTASTWAIPPSDPNFFFICTKSNEESNPDNFNYWVEILSQDKNFFEDEDLVSVFSTIGSCPFSS